MKHPAPRVLALALVVATLALALTGCNVVALKQGSLERSLRAAGMRVADVQLGPDTIHYWSGGQGPTVLLVHGFGASGMWLWAPQVVELARDHRVIMPDLLWFGESRSADRDFSLDHQVRAMGALLDRLGVRETDVVGVSYGGLVAQELASVRGVGVRHLVLSDTPGRVYTREDYAALCARLRTDHLGKVLVPDGPDGVKTLLDLAYFDPPWTPGFAREQAFSLLYSGHRAERIGMLDALLRDMDALKARPNDTKARTTVIWGREDEVFPLEIGYRLAKSLNAPLRIIDDARHAPNLEHPEQFDRYLREALADSP